FFIGRAEVMAEVVRRGEVPSVHGKRPITAVQLVWSDPALALAVSARASARYGPRPLGEAIRLLGEEAIRRRILPAMLQRTEYFRGLRHAVSTLYFQQALTRAYLAYGLARPHGATVAQNAYQAALLLHLGKQALLVVLHTLSGSPVIPATAEINRFLERYHPKVGAMLTERFGCLPQVSEALRQQREKLDASTAPILSKIVQLAERIRRREVLTEDVLLSEGMMDQICAVAGSLPPLREHIERRLSPLLNPTSTRASGG
ncbi:MAG: HDOD domain-containing protein, partial [Deltaproteobacteria bacterium]